MDLFDDILPVRASRILHIITRKVCRVCVWNVIGD